jgi:acyl-CoA synthetase (AMP-forming)/AMP-acid ligase II
MSVSATTERILAEGVHGLLRRRAEEWGERTAYIFCDGGNERAVSFGELESRVLDVAFLLRERGAEGQRVLLAHGERFDYAVGFFACLEAGAVAVSAHAPEPARPASTVGALERLAAASDARLALASSQEIAVAGGGDGTPAITWIDAGEARDGAGTREPLMGDQEAPAYIQATSGSTGEMKGVELSHRSLLSNLEVQRESLPVSEDSVIVSWLTLTHDMGFVAPLLQPLWVGCRSVLLTPIAFLVRPVCWLEAITRHRGTIAAAPNFGFDRVVERTTFDERAQLDLSSWACAINGAEPVSAHTLERFERAFSPVGFRSQAWAPLFGLAEMTCEATRPSAAQRPVIRWFDRDALSRGEVVAARDAAQGAEVLVGCGSAPAAHQVLIVDPDSREPCPPERTGEIWTAGPSAALGYLGGGPDSSETFGARLAGGEGPFVRTGDIGLLVEGELFVCGRIKEIVIVRGRKHSPHDIERTAASSSPRLAGGRGAAFALTIAEEERLAVVHEVSDPRGGGTDEVIAAVRSAVAREHGVRVEVVILVEPGAIPCTASGKIRRGECRDAFLGDSVARVVARDPCESS